MDNFENNTNINNNSNELNRNKDTLNQSRNQSRPAGQHQSSQPISVNSSTLVGITPEAAMQPSTGGTPSFLTASQFDASIGSRSMINFSLFSFIGALFTSAIFLIVGVATNVLFGALFSNGYLKVYLWELFFLILSSASLFLGVLGQRKKSQVDLFALLGIIISTIIVMASVMALAATARTQYEYNKIKKSFENYSSSSSSSSYESPSSGSSSYGSGSSSYEYDVR